MAAADHLQSLKQAIAEAQAAGDPKRIAGSVLDYVTAAGPAVTDCLSQRDFAAAETLLAEWRDVIEANKAHLSHAQVYLVFGRWHNSSGFAAELKAQSQYFLDSDYVNAPGTYAEAEAHHGKAREFFGRIVPPQGAPAEAAQLQASQLAALDAEIRQVRGMKLMTRGEFEMEAGSLAEAIELLDRAAAEFEAGELPAAAKAARDQAIGPDTGYADLNFIDYAAALGWRAKSELALLKGDVAEAARCEKQRAMALERCQEMHARAGGALGPFWRRRLARDAFVAGRRHERFESVAMQVPGRSSINYALFFVLAGVGVVGLFLLLNWLGLAGNQFVVGALMLVAIVVAALATRLATFKEAADLLTVLVSRGAGKKKDA